MIEVNVREDGLTVSGHAYYAESGYDIVCAGMTALVQSLIRSMIDLTEDVITWDAAPGRASIKYKNLSERGKLLMDSFFVGVCLIINEFPTYVRIV